MEQKKRPNLNDEQRMLIKVLYRDLKQTPEQIMQHESLRRANGQLIQKKTVLNWINRFEETNTVNLKKKTGRPRKLNESEEVKLAELVKNNPKVGYRIIKRIGNFQVSRRTLNDYTLRNGFSAESNK